MYKAGHVYCLDQNFEEYFQIHANEISLSGKVPCRLVKFNYNFKDFGIYCVLSLKFLAKLLKNNYVYISQSNYLQ